MMIVVFVVDIVTMFTASLFFSFVELGLDLSRPRERRFLRQRATALHRESFLFYRNSNMMNVGIF